MHVLDYFAPSPMYSEELLKCQYKMSCKLFMRILQTIFDYAIFYCENEIAQGSLHCLQFRNLFRMLAYKTKIDSIDEYSHLAKSTTMEFVKWLVACHSCNFSTKVPLKTHESKYENSAQY